MRPRRRRATSDHHQAGGVRHRTLSSILGGQEQAGGSASGGGDQAAICPSRKTSGDRAAYLELQGHRELVIPFGNSGYVALYRYEPGDDAVLILAFRHQKEAGY
jgi:hypothetical protein